MKTPPHPETLAAQGPLADTVNDRFPAVPGSGFGELAAPIHLSTTYQRGANGELPGGRLYSRDHNPTYDTPETLLAALEGGHEALLFASGMAAATSVLQALRPGDRVLAPRDMYWGWRRQMIDFCTTWGLPLAWYDSGDHGQLAAALAEAPTRLLWIETPANPGWQLTDIALAAREAQRHGCTVVVDSTCASPVLTRPLELGADLVMHSATKYLNGHSDVVAGALVCAAASPLWERIRQMRLQGGAVLGPFEAWLLLRGMRTLFLRVRTASANALALARFLEARSEVLAVAYPGLPSHPAHDLACRQMQGGFGGMLSVRIRGGAAAAQAVCSRLQVFRRATSLGSVESLVEHRAPVEGPDSRCPDDLLRLSVGIEHVDDLLADFAQALPGVPG